MYLQTGDVLLKQVKTIPTDAIQILTDLLWKGESHHHRLQGQFKIFKQNESIFVASNGAEMIHEEHKTVALPEGLYVLDVVREFDHLLEESRRVID